jgi:hypothetical protein
MMRRPLSHPDQLALGFGKDAELERLIEARAEIRAEAAAVRWRLRLALIEAGLLVATIVIAGSLMGQSAGVILRSALLVGGACLVTGMLVVALSAGAGAILSRFRRGRVLRKLGRRR